MTIRAVVGARVSIMDDGKESQITQRSKGIAYAESQGWDVVGTVEDLDVSAIKVSPFDRPDLKIWLERPQDFDALIFAKTDRVFRQAADCVRLAEWCRDNSKILVLVDDGIRLDYFSPEDSKDAFAGAMSKVFLILASVFAEIEGQRFVQRANDRVTQYRFQPRWAYGVPPYGFLVVDRPEGGKMLGHDPVAQEVLHDIARRLLAGDSLTRITSDMKQSDTPSPADRLRQRTGKDMTGSQWTIVTVKTVLSNPATQGIKTAKGRPVLDDSGEPVLVGPPSFDAQTWNRIQSELLQRSQSGRQRRHTVNPLLGVAKCGKCGKNMRQLMSRSGRYYVCGATPKACPKVLIPADKAERLVEKLFLWSHQGRRVKERVWVDGSDNSAELESTISTIDGLREDRAMGLFTTKADQDLYRQQIAALVQKRDRLASQPVVKAGWVDVETAQEYSAVWPDATVEERRKLLVDAGVVLTVRRSNEIDLSTDLTTVLGDGSTGWIDFLAELKQAGIAGVTVSGDEISVQ